MRRVGNRGEHLGCSNVRPAEHSDSSIGIRQRGSPLYRVITVIRFVLENVPLTFGGVSPAHVLENDNVPSSGRLQAEADAVVLVVRCALQQNWKLAVGGGAKDVGVEDHAVAHFDGNVPLVRDRIWFGGKRAGGERQREDRDCQHCFGSIHYRGLRMN